MNRLDRIRLARPRTYRIVRPAWVDAQASGRTQIDLDDILVALYCLGGPATELLAGHGVSLGSLRRAIRDRDDADMVAIGIDPTRLPRLDRLTIQQVLRTTRRIHATPEAERVLELLPMDDLALLTTLVGIPGGGPANALTRCGVNVAALQDDCRHAPRSADRPVPRPVDGLLDGVPETTIASTHFIPAPMDTVVQIVQEPARAAQWLLPGLDASTDPAGMRVGGLEYRRVGDHTTPSGRQVTWQEFRPGAIPGAYLHLDLTPAPGGTRLQLTRGFRGYGRHERLTRTLAARLAQLTPGSLAQHITLLAERDHPANNTTVPD